MKPLYCSLRGASLSRRPKHDRARRREWRCYSLSRAPNRGGFTLIEMMISLVVIVIGIFGTFALMVTAIQVDSEAAHYSIARAAAQQQIENLRLTPWASITTGTTTGTVSNLPAGTWTQVVAAYSGGSGMYVGTVTVAWTEPGRGTDSFAVDTYFTQGGLNLH